ncbi:cysteine dioxygenase [Streptomyces sp. NPDC018045]|uniref:cysteine dioxygenase n=1 Tax=Streptomyces sp. NPDC018045 TaxID=3365037 RepID=UPI0037B694E2
MPAPPLTPRLARLVTDIRTALRAPGGGAPAEAGRRVADALAAHLGRPGLLTAAQCAADPLDYRQHLLHAEPDGTFSVVALVWLPGQRTCVHDHVAWCVTGTYRGVEEERRYRLADDGTGRCLVPAGRSTNGPGTVAFVAPPGDIHEVRNAADGTAVSLHVYGADLSRTGTSIRRRYDLPVRPPGDTSAEPSAPVRDGVRRP